MYYVWKEWKESVRGKGLWLINIIFIVLSLIILLKSSALSFDRGSSILLLNLFESLIYFIPILCLFHGAFSIFQEKEQKTFIILLTKRDSFTSFFIKKSIAIIIIFLAPMISWFFLYLLPLKMMFTFDWKGYSYFLLTILALCLIFLQLGVFIGSISRSRMQMIGYSMLIWFYFFFLHDFILLSLLPSVTYENVKLFSLAFFINPLQAARVFIESGLGVYSSGHMSRLMELFLWLKPIVFLTYSMVIWVLIPSICAILFHRKEGI